MTDEPYRWLEAIANRREYAAGQLKGGSPVFAASLAEGILLLGVGTGQSKVFELFDRHALAGLGHPADLERLRQAVIDTAHLEAFTRAPEDVSLRRLVSYGLSPQLKNSFEQIFAAPFLVKLLLAEVGNAPDHDVLVRLNFDGGFHLQPGGVLVAADDADTEAEAQKFLEGELPGREGRAAAADLLLQVWRCLVERQPLKASPSDDAGHRAGLKTALAGRVLEAGWLARGPARRARFAALTPADLSLE